MASGTRIGRDRNRTGAAAAWHLNLAKVGVVSSNLIVRSKFLDKINLLDRSFGAAFCLQGRTNWKCKLLVSARKRKTGYGSALAAVFRARWARLPGAA